MVTSLGNFHVRVMTQDNSLVFSRRMDWFCKMTWYKKWEDVFSTERDYFKYNMGIFYLSNIKVDYYPKIKNIIEDENENKVKVKLL